MIDDDKLCGYPTLQNDWAVDLYRKHGMEPPRTRIWNNGENVTDDPPLDGRRAPARSRHSGRCTRR